MRLVTPRRGKERLDPVHVKPSIEPRHEPAPGSSGLAFPIVGWTVAGTTAGIGASLWALVALADVNPTVHPDAVSGLARYFATFYGVGGAIAGLVAAVLLRVLARFGVPAVVSSAGSVGLLIAGAAGIATASPRVLALAAHPEIGESTSAPAPAGAGARVLLLGLDGVDWRELDALVSEGELPNISRLVESGSRAPLQTLSPTWSPLIWNTIATGVEPERHGIIDFAQLRLRGVRCGPQRLDMLPRRIGVGSALRIGKHLGVVRESPVSGCHRRVKAVWNQLDDAGLRVAVVNWFASFPAEVVDGYVVSDHNPMRAAFLKGRHGALIDSSAPITHPSDLLEKLSASELVTPSAPTPLDVLDHPIFAYVPAADRERLAENTGLLEVAGRIIDADRFAARIAAGLLEREPLDFLAVYMSGIDNIGHRYGLERGVVHNFYRMVDGLVGEILGAAGRDVTVIMVSDHGWSYDEDFFGHNHAPDGVFLASGPGARTGAQLEQKPRVHDIAPTILALFGLPAAEGSDGRALRGALEPDRAARAPRLNFDYGGYRAPEDAAPSATASVLEEETMQKLRALGYVE
jgi:hypothetical protein